MRVVSFVLSLGGAVSSTAVAFPLLPPAPCLRPFKGPRADPQQPKVSQVQGKLSSGVWTGSTSPPAGPQVNWLRGSGSQTGKRKVSGIPVPSPEPLTIVGNRVGACFLRGHLPGPQDWPPPPKLGWKLESAQKRARNRGLESAHAPSSTRSFPHRLEVHSYQVRMREAEASFPVAAVKLPESQSDERT